MSDTTRLMLTALLLPVVWVLIQHFLCRPLNKFVHAHLPPRLAKILTRRYFEKEKCPP